MAVVASLALAVVLLVSGCSGPGDDPSPDVRPGPGGAGSRRVRPADLPARLFWCDPGRVLVPGVLDLTTDDAVGTQRVPAMAQGAVWADLGPYQQQGGRPVVPMLARFDVRDGIDRWARQDCRPDSPS